jgi:DNA-binding transcriptional LysR family regulator
MVVRSGSFADAARRLGYTGSAVSQQISALERQLRATLFERDAHSVRPTPAAEFVVARCSAALGALHALEEDIDLFMGGALGTLRLGSFPTASEQLLPRALSSFKASSPGIEVHLDEAEPARLIARLESREIDVALLYRYSHVPRRWPKSVGTETVIREDLLVLRPATPTLLQQEDVDLADLLEETWISTGEATAGAAVLRHLGRDRGFEPAVSYRSDNYGVIQGLVRAGLGIALVPALGYRPDPAVAATPLRGAPACREVVVASSPTSPEKIVSSLTSAVRRAARQTADTFPGITYLAAPTARHLSVTERRAARSSPVR